LTPGQSTELWKKNFNNKKKILHEFWMMWHWHSRMTSVCLHPIFVIVIVIAILIFFVIVIFTPGSQPFHRLKFDVQQLETVVSYEVPTLFTIMQRSGSGPH
jgi:hypothetical protein